jgi:putative ABC transport system permease protein
MLTELRHALRRLRRTPWFTLSAIVTLAFAVGANVAVLGTLHAVLFRPLPVADDGRLVVAYGKDAGLGLATQPVSYVMFREWRRDTSAFEQMAAVSSSEYDLTGQEAAERADVQVVSSGLFETLGVRPILGRTFTDRDLLGSAIPPCVIGFSLWQRRYGGAPNVLGRILVADGMSFVIAGVMPGSFEEWRRHADVWVPIDAVPGKASRKEQRGYRVYEVIGRLRPGVTLAAAQVELERVTGAVERPSRGGSAGVNVVALRTDIVGVAAQRLLVFLGIAAGLVWLIACANLAALAAARTVDRRGEFALRIALGASRALIARQLVAESSVLALVGGGGGLLVARWVGQLLLVYGPSVLARGSFAVGGGLSWAVAAALACLTALATGLWPAMRLSRLSHADFVRRGLGAGTVSVGRLQDLAVAAQFALAIPLVVCCGLVTVSYANLERVPLGFQPGKLLTFRVGVPAPYLVGGADGRPRYPQLHALILRQLSDVPGVRAVAMTADLPTARVANRSSILIEGGQRFHNGVPADRPFTPGRHRVTPGYFQIMRIPLIAGRLLDAHDVAGAEPVAVVSDTMARTHWPGQNPIGRRLTFDVGARPGVPMSEPWLTIVGIVGDVRYGGPEVGLKPEVYCSFLQFGYGEPYVVIEPAGEPSTILGVAVRQVRRVDSAVPVFAMISMRGRSEELTAEARARAGILTGLTLLALVLACWGVYASVSGRVMQRRHEIALRVALGAMPGRIVRMTIVRLAAVLGAGTAAGLVLAGLTTRLLASQLFGITPLEPRTLVTAISVLVTVGMVAAAIPARLAGRVDPIEVLREQ